MWQPIETAPKDGTQILAAGSFCKAYDGKLGPFSIWVVKWEESEELQDAGDGLFRKVKTGQWCGSINFQATHWMPLPDPPEVA